MGANPDMNTLTLEKAEDAELSAIQKFTALDSDNPVLICNRTELKAASAAFLAVAGMIKVLNEQHAITNEDRKELMGILLQIYTERKANRFIKNRFHIVAKTMSQMIDFTMNKTSLNSPNRETSLFYYNSIRHTVKDEQ